MERGRRAEDKGVDSQDGVDTAGELLAVELVVVVVVWLEVELYVLEELVVT
jgi:hypothetical protein